MKRIILVITVFSLLALSSNLLAQDARFSQYFNNTLLLNPAFAGNGIEHIRLTAIYRNQWAGMGTPFTTQGFAVDKVVNRFGIGAAITRNGAGDASIKTLNFVGNLSYHQPLGAEKLSTLSAGIQVGIVNKSFDPSKLSFDNQYNPDAGYDPNMSSGEDFSSTSVTRPDLNAGITWQRGWLNKELRFKPFVGLSFSHLTKPDETFIMEATQVHIKRTFYGGAGYQLNPSLEIRPSVMLLNQGPSKETTFGTLLSYQLDNKNTVQLGAYNRMNDAVIAYAGYQMNLLFVGMSYDVNTSELSKSGKGNNAFEISLTYSPRSKRKKEPVVTEKEPEAPRPDNTELMDVILTPAVSIAILETLEFNPVQNDVTEIPAPVEEQVAAPIPVIEEPSVAVAAPVVPEDVPAVIDPAIEKITAPETEKPPVAVVTPEVAPVIVVPEIIAETPAVVPAKINPPAVTDSDQDGVADPDDECPYIKGSNTSKGCPDSDGDGLIDMKDNCPMESGTIANNGCPEAGKPEMPNSQELVKKFDNILFAPGLVRMTTDDIFDIIERAIDIMYADKSTKVLLSGHTDSEGDQYQNMILSQARAEVVKRYMIQQGIHASRIETVAYGETMPLEKNNSAEGMKQNRRVEINILKK